MTGKHRIYESSEGHPLNTKTASTLPRTVPDGFKKRLNFAL